MIITGLQTALDNTGNPYPAVRPRIVQMLATTTGAATASAAFQPQTKVVRICPSTDTIILMTGVITTGFVVTAGHYQDFIVNPGDQITAQAIATAGNCGLMELM
jgi:hypothetical protein